MTFMETMRNGDETEIFEKIFPIVAVIVGIYLVVLVVLGFIDFGAAIGLLFVTVLIAALLMIGVLITGAIAEGIANMVASR